MMREMRQTKINGIIYLFPVPVVKDRKFLILCASELEAQKVATAIHEGKLVHPDLISEDFLFITFHTDNRTKIFSLNPKVTL